MGPGVHHAAPGQRNQEPDGRAYEEDAADPVNATELGQEVAFQRIEREEECNHYCADADKWEVDIEDPVKNVSEQLLAITKAHSYHLHETSWAKAPPISGPPTEPNAHIAPMML